VAVEFSLIFAQNVLSRDQKLSRGNGTFPRGEGNFSNFDAIVLARDPKLGRGD
jgi:hypothetical protein